MRSVTVLPDGVTVPLADGETVLEGLYRAGYAYRTGCRRGGCGVCKVALVRGAVEYRRTVADTVLTPDERSSGAALTCRAVPTEDITIALRDDDKLRCTTPLLALLRGTNAGRTGPEE